MTNQENQLNQLIQRIMMIQQVENWSWFFCKVPQVYWVLFRYLPELTGPKLSFTRSRRHDEPAEPIESTHTLQIVLQNSAQSWEKSDILQLKKSTLINSHYMLNIAQCTCTHLLKGRAHIKWSKNLRISWQSYRYHQYPKYIPSYLEPLLTYADNITELGADLRYFMMLIVRLLFIPTQDLLAL